MLMQREKYSKNLTLSLIPNEKHEWNFCDFPLMQMINSKLSNHFLHN